MLTGCISALAGRPTATSSCVCLRAAKMSSPFGRRAEKVDKGAVKINLRESFIEARDW